MIPKDKIDEILSRTDIVDVVGAFVKLTKKGVNHQACCPFHDEKTPSFSVSQSKQIYKCFGCGEGGDAVGFLMRHEKMTYPEALRWLAKRHHIEVEEITLTPEEQANQEAAAKRKASIITALRMIQDFYIENLQQNSKALEYLGNERQVSAAISATFQLGYAPNNIEPLLKYCTDNGLKTEFLVEIGTLKEGKHGLYDPFYNRIIFPIWDHYGSPVGFSGRIIPSMDDLVSKIPRQKYINSAESEIYHKGQTLYGYHIAHAKIRKTKTVYLVEGNTDCMRLHAIGRTNTVAQLGTALTTDQIALLKKSGAETVILCYDSDAAGMAATIKNGEALVKDGFAVQILQLGKPDANEKTDADTFFKTINIEDYETEQNLHDYMTWRFAREYDAAKTPVMKSGVVQKFADLLTATDDNTATFYVDEIGKRYKIKQQLSQTYKRCLQRLKDENKPITPSFRTGHHSAQNEEEEDPMLKRYGFMEENGKYWFQRIGNYGSNFILKPLFHVESVSKPKRIFSIINEYGIAHQIELDQKDLISLQSFKLKVEGLGNFLWKTDEISLTQLKAYMYDNTKSCKELEQLGWQAQGFWAWCNGIFYNNVFYPIDEMGVVELPDDMGNYYLPALSTFYKRDKDIYESERRFVFRPESQTSLRDFSKMMTDVFGDNAIVLILFYINTLFRDIIVKKTNNFPLLNLFGLKGTGKSELYHTILQAFGHHPMAPNINSSSKASLGDHVAQYSNALCAIDEYKNSLEFEKIEFLKGLYNSTGRTRMNMDKDKKKETTKADVGIIIAGQEMPTADIALFSRLLYTTFTKTEHTPEETKKYEQLKETAANGFTNITHEILSLRDNFKENYDKGYETAMELLSGEMENIQYIEDRILKNWLMILAGYIAIADKISVCFTQNQIVTLFAQCIEKQNSQVQSGNEISVFWDTVEYIFKETFIKNEIDFKIVQREKLKTNKYPDTIEWAPPKNILLMDPGRIFPLYRKHAKQITEQVLPLQSLEFYVKNSKEYLGMVDSVKFKVENPDTGKMENYDQTKDFVTNTAPIHKYKVTRALAFDYDKLQQNGINMHISETNDDDDDEQINEKIF